MEVCIGLLLFSIILFIFASLILEKHQEAGGFFVVLFLVSWLATIVAGTTFISSFYQARSINKQYSTTYTANDLMFNEKLIMDEIRTQYHINTSRKAIDLTVSP